MALFGKLRFWFGKAGIVGRGLVLPGKLRFRYGRAGMAWYGNGMARLGSVG